MKQTKVFLTEQQAEWLKAAAAHTGLKPSEIIRRALDEYRSQRRHSQQQEETDR